MLKWEACTSTLPNATIHIPIRLPVLPPFSNPFIEPARQLIPGKEPVNQYRETYYMHIVFELLNNSSKSVQIIAKPYIEKICLITYLTSFTYQHPQSFYDYSYICRTNKIKLNCNSNTLL